jgi:hypothetical protein
MRICSDFTAEQLEAIRDFLVDVGEAATEVVGDLYQRDDRQKP